MSDIETFEVMMQENKIKTRGIKPQFASFDMIFYNCEGHSTLLWEGRRKF